ncbi:hypothetical protein F511_16888 [Dorcoceras hygrometricum]|uniref:Uncharacterized protein n=1 Tax=Dorcoceras hygrometricum TaxID=472368 RepID=A0A2Z7DH32_9LAMI|nr:hypothetical protein F511_16888 [Dorcoceras hygrometricum]
MSSPDYDLVVRSAESIDNSSTPEASNREDENPSLTDNYRARIVRIDQDEARLTTQGCTWYEIKASTLRQSDISYVKDTAGITSLYEIIIPHIHARAHRLPAGFHTFYINQIDRGLSIGYPRMRASGESSTTKHRLLHASGSHPIPPPNDPKTNQYNQDLGLIHSINGNHLKSPNEGSSIDHQVTIHLHAQNITMFPTHETWYFTSQMLVSSSGGLILILTAQSTRNEFRIHNAMPDLLIGAFTQGLRGGNFFKSRLMSLLLKSRSMLMWKKYSPRGGMNRDYHIGWSGCSDRETPAEAIQARTSFVVGRIHCLNTLEAFCLRAKGSVDGFCNGNNQQVATVHPDENYSSLYTQTQATVIQSQALQDQRLDNQLQAYLHQLVNQSLAHLDHQLMYQSFLFTSTTACATADLSSSTDYDDVTDYIIIDGPLRCSSWFPFDVPAGPPSSSSACSWFLSFQLVHYALAGSTWPPPDYEQLTQLWTSPLLIQLPFTMINQTSC